MGVRLRQVSMTVLWTVLKYVYLMHLQLKNNQTLLVVDLAISTLGTRGKIKLDIHLFDSWIIHTSLFIT